jgi:hypothetical protein
MPMFFHKVGRLYVNFPSHGHGFRTFLSMLNKYAAVAYRIFDLHHETCNIALSGFGIAVYVHSST